MSYNSIVSNPDCRRFVSEGFEIVSNGDGSFRDQFDVVCGSSWTRYKSPFYEAGRPPEGAEYGVFRLAGSIGFNVAFVDAFFDANPTDEFFFNPDLIPAGMLGRPALWLTEGPVKMLSSAREKLNPLDPMSVIEQGFWQCYGGASKIAQALIGVQ